MTPSRACMCCESLHMLIVYVPCARYRRYSSHVMHLAHRRSMHNRTSSTESMRRTRRKHLSNIVLAMTDDQGWGEMGYRGHKLLRTPNLVEMANNGLRLERFYTSPVCSPTRASALTGRAAVRTGVVDQGRPLRLQENKTIARALQNAGWATGHFGKWHLDGLHSVGMGGAPVLANHSHNPSAFGFSYWLSNFGVFDVDPVLSELGTFKDFLGDTSDILVAEALKWIRNQQRMLKPTFAAIWYPSPHEPWIALDADRAAGAGLFKSRYYGESVAIDRSMGTLRRGLRELGIENSTLLWFNSDNGGVPGFPIPPNGDLRGFKKQVFEGGIRVPAIVEWSSVIAPGRVSWFPTCIYDIFPTIVELLGLSPSVSMSPQDGISLVDLFAYDIEKRNKPIGIAYRHNWVLIDNEIKFILSGGVRYFYNLSKPVEHIGASPAQIKKAKEIAAIRGSEEAMDPSYKHVLQNLSTSAYLWRFSTGEERRIFEHIMWLQQQMQEFMMSVNGSKMGLDYPELKVQEGPGTSVWCATPLYRPFLSELLARPQYLIDIRRLTMWNFSWWPEVYKSIDPKSLNLNMSIRPRSRFEQLGGYLRITSSS